MIACAVCGAAAASVAPSGSAEPQAPYPPKRIAVRWLERAPLAEGHVEFRVTLIEASTRGWRVRARITNRSPFTLRIPRRITMPGRPGEPATSQWIGPGIVRFLSRKAPTPNSLFGRATVFRSTTVEPAIPPELAPGETWTGAFGGARRLPRRTPLSILFGRFNYFTDGYLHALVWTSDHVFRV